MRYVQAGFGLAGFIIVMAVIITGIGDSGEIQDSASLTVYMLTAMFAVGTSFGVFISLLILKKDIYDTNKNK